MSAVDRAKMQSELARARVMGMKIAAQIDPPRAATGGFPYPARTCAEWKQSEADGRTHPRSVFYRPTERAPLAPEMTLAQRKADAKNGSAALREAIERAAA